ncbi:MAG: hypothetical protein RL095_2177 [Verrucomicrobiota bacterium]|jgi:hypothetical protein
MSKTKKITLTIGEIELEFNVGLKEYEDFQNELASGKGISAPAKNLLRRTVKAEQKEQLLGFCEDGLASEIAGTVIQEFRPKVEISVKKSTSSSPD